MVHVKNSIAVFIPIVSQAVGGYELTGSSLVVGSTVVKAAVNCLKGIYYRKNEEKLNDLQIQWAVLKKDFNQALYDIAMAVLAITSILGAVRYYVTNKNEKNEARIASIIRRAKEHISKREYSQAVTELERASKLGSVAADIELANLLMNYDAVRNNKRGVDLLTKAAEKGDAEAQYKLAFHFRTLADADGASKLDKENNQRLRVQWLRKAAVQGHADAQAELGYVYRNVPYFKENDGEKHNRLGLYWTKTGSDKSDVARYNYALRLFRDADAVGVEPKVAERLRKEGQKLMLEAANNGYSDAMCRIAEYMENKWYGYSEGLTAEVQARYWYDKAARLGNQTARTAITRLDAPRAAAAAPAAAAAAVAAAAPAAAAAAPVPPSTQQSIQAAAARGVASALGGAP